MINKKNIIVLSDSIQGDISCNYNRKMIDWSAFFEIWLHIHIEMITEVIFLAMQSCCQEIYTNCVDWHPQNINKPTNLSVLISRDGIRCNWYGCVPSHI